ncbi:serpentine type 7TM GPCR chemoreceptor str domain-containing protein [Ditylenchus destructor]|nr:serpentine type 7TM GPCR chemoreceptor str domain-containing protein [Ditylenchus destructor]
MKDPMWFNEQGEQVVFFGAKRNNLFLLLFVCTSGFYNALSCGIVFWLGLATFRTIRESQQIMSSKTKNLQKQMNRILVAEAFSVLFVINVPIGGLLAALFLNINIAGFGIVMTMIFIWIPLSNPIITILFVGSYRQAAFGWIQRRENRVSDA